MKFEAYLNWQGTIQLSLYPIPSLPLLYEDFYCPAELSYRKFRKQYK